MAYLTWYDVDIVRVIRSTRTTQNHSEPYRLFFVPSQLHWKTPENNPEAGLDFGSGWHPGRGETMCRGWTEVHHCAGQGIPDKK